MSSPVFVAENLRIPVEKVEDAPQHFALESHAEWWEGARAVLDEPRIALRAPFRASLEGYRIGARLLFRGRLEGIVDLLCGRCGAPFALHFDEPLELLLEPAASGTAVPEGGILLDPEDLELGQYAGEELDFGPVMLEILALAWPMQPRCSEECRGLCPVCGNDRNVEMCSCETEAANRPFADLDKLLEQSRAKPPKPGRSGR